MSFTTMNVHDVSVGSINQFQKLTAQLFSKKNTRSNNNRSCAIVDSIMCGNGILNHAHGFTTTSGHNHLTFIICKHTISDALLMWTELH